MIYKKRKRIKTMKYIVSIICFISLTLFYNVAGNITHEDFDSTFAQRNFENGNLKEALNYIEHLQYRYSDYIYKQVLHLSQHKHEKILEQSGIHSKQAFDLPIYEHTITSIKNTITDLKHKLLIKTYDTLKQGIKADQDILQYIIKIESHFQ